MARTAAVIEVLDPTGKARVQEVPLAPRITTMESGVAGFLNNSKPNADIFLARIRDLLMQKYRLQDVLWISKQSASTSGTEQHLAQLRDRCHFVINAWGD